MYLATFYNITDYASWKFTTKLYIADYESDARANAEKDWEENYKGWRMEFKSIPHFDQYHSAVVSEHSK
jgi:hypothetical protein